MSNLGPQFQVKDWNPFAAAAGMIANVSLIENMQHRKALTQLAAHNKPIQPTEQRSTTITEREKPTPQNTGAPQPGYRKRGPVNPSTTGAPMPGKSTTNSSPSVPVKPKGAKPTAPGTRPKPPKSK